MLKGKDCQPRIAYLAKRTKWGFPGGSAVKRLPANAGDAGSVAAAGDPTGRRAATVLEPVLWSHPQLRSRRAPEPAHAEPLRREARAPQLQHSPAHSGWKEPPRQPRPSTARQGTQSAKASAGGEEDVTQTNRRRKQRDLTGCPAGRLCTSLPGAQV